MRLSRLIALLLGPLLCAGVAEPQIITVIRNRGETILCMRTGLQSDQCGVRAKWYTYVFVGSISAIRQTEDGENELQIDPEEIFRGNPTTPLMVLTSQAACLPKLTVGDGWLFFLRKQEGKPIVLDYYGNDSLPIADAEQQVETLRRLLTIGAAGIVRGQVVRDPGGQREPVDQAAVIARGGPGDRQFVSTTDGNGRFEFPVLPAGAYKIIVQPVGPFQADDASLHVRPGSCQNVTVTRNPHAQIDGYVRHSDGSPAVGAEALIIPTDESWWSTFPIGTSGHFQFDSLREGDYVIGVRLPSATPWESEGGTGVPPPPASVYYPGAPSRSAAAVITLRTDEKREDIDFIIPQ